LGLIGSEQKPSLAWNALEAGFHGPALGRLAALNKPNGSEVQHCSHCVERLEWKILRWKKPLTVTRAFELLWTKAGYPAGLAVGGSLADAVNVARCMGSPDTKIRLQVAKASTEFAGGRTAEDLLVV
jgi:hypothetical protein